MSWMREPFLHFIVLGGVLFAVDSWIADGETDPNVIAVGPEVDAEAIRVFRDSRGREPNRDELLALHRVWLDNEVLYREGLAMGLEKGDDAIRQRVIFKALSVIDANVRVPEIDDAKLREWFEANRAKYDEPRRFTFEEAALREDPSEGAVRAFVDQLNSGTPGDAQAGLRVFRDRPYSNIVQSYGEVLAKALEAATPGKWHALQTKEGWRALKVVSVTERKSADYEELRAVVYQDWKDATAMEQRTAAVRALAKKYDVKLETGR